MRNVGIILRRELASYFATPLAYVFILIFLVLANWFTFYLGGFYERGQADLAPFFAFHPWLYLFLIPAIVMPVTIALARMYRGEHHPTDILASVLFAGLWLIRTLT